jgi:hypothetical protein
VVRRVLHLFLGFALLSGLAYSQDGDQKGKIAIHGESRRFAPMLYTAEYKYTQVLTENDTPLHPESTYIRVQDSQGCHLYAVGYDSWSLGPGAFGDFTVDDPIAGRMIFWNAFHPEAKLLEYATPVRGRKSCWQVAPEDKLPRSGATCQPAEQLQLVIFACRNEVVEDAPLTLNWPPADATYQDCARELSPAAVLSSVSILEKKDEDLGTDTVLGFEAHGCRSTTETSIREYWMIEFGDEKHNLRFVVRSKWTQQPSGEVRTEELTRLDLAEPAPSFFEPPKKYAIKTVVMHEVPCSESSTQPASSTPSP